MSVKRRWHYGWVIVAVSFISMFIGLGPRGSFPIFYVAMLEEFHWTRAGTAGVFSIGMLTAAITMPIVGTLFDRYGPKLLMGIGSVVLALGLAAASRTGDIWQLYISYGIVVTAGMSCVSVVPHTAIITNWFTTRSGRAIGLATSGMGGSYAIAILSQYVTSNYGWRNGYLVLGILVAVIVLPLVLAFQRLRTPSPSASGERAGERSTAMPAPQGQRLEKGNPPGKAGEGWTLRRAMRTSRFWMVFLAFFLSGYASFLIGTHQVAFNVDMGYSQFLAASMVGLFGIVNTFGRMGGFLSDRIGREGAYSMGAGGSAVAIMLLLLARNPLNPFFLYGWALLFGLGIGLMGPSILATTADLFKGRHLGAIIGFMGLGFNAGGALGPWVGGYIYDVLGKYDTAFYSAIAAAVLSAMFIWVAAPRKARRE
ncbi:MAG: MFS transporter [Dehalococcoidia bacterium]|nr:MFS transporter [Dehalococcoidia bacterium]